MCSLSWKVIRAVARSRERRGKLNARVYVASTFIDFSLRGFHCSLTRFALLSLSHLLAGLFTLVPRFRWVTFWQLRTKSVHRRRRSSSKRRTATWQWWRNKKFLTVSSIRGALQFLPAFWAGTFVAFFRSETTSFIGASTNNLAWDSLLRTKAVISQIIHAKRVTYCHHTISHRRRQHKIFIFCMLHSYLCSKTSPMMFFFRFLSYPLFFSSRLPVRKYYFSSDSEDNNADNRLILYS